MDLKALNAVKRIDLVNGLLRSNQLSLVESTLTDYISNNNIENAELAEYKALLTQVKSSPLSSLTERLDLMRSNYLLKIFSNPCSKNWDNLTPTQNDEIRFCADCVRNVYKVHNKEEYR